MAAEVDGPTLRVLRQRKGKALRVLAELAGRSPGHLSKMERGEPGRVVTPAILLAYSRHLGIDVRAEAAHLVRSAARDPAALAELALCASQANSLQSHPVSVRHYHLIALYAAVDADHPDLRARALTVIAQALVDLDDHRGGLAIVRLAEGDERLSEEARMAIKTLRSHVDGDARV